MVTIEYKIVDTPSNRTWLFTVQEPTGILAAKELKAALRENQVPEPSVRDEALALTKETLDILKQLLREARSHNED